MDAVGSGLRVVLRGKEAASTLLCDGAVILPEQQALLMRIRAVKDLIHIREQLRTDERRGNEQDLRAVDMAVKRPVPNQPDQALRTGSGIIGIFLRAVCKLSLIHISEPSIKTIRSSGW